ncbi:MAG: hypothetical protein LBI13_08530 [Streptococcaceae bacterium]|jgi:hypothetical protein|nr:hypothetical protein [Streptococcaceae bacterium]
MTYHETEQKFLVQRLQSSKNIGLITRLFSETEELDGCKFLFFEKNSGAYMPVPSYNYDDLSVIGIYGFDNLKYLDKNQSLALMQGGESQLWYAICIDFDSNILGRMPRLFRTKNFQKDQELFMFLRELYIQENFQKMLGRRTDFSCAPYILENCLMIFDKAREEGVRGSLQAFFTYQSFASLADFDMFFNRDQIYPTQSVNLEVEETIKEMKKMKKELENYSHQISQKPIQLLLLEAAIIHLSAPKGASSKQKIKKFLEFWANNLGIFLEREQAIIILFFQKDQRTTRFFKRYTKENKAILKDILGMSWDLCHIREMERYIFQSAYEKVSFENHLLATSDKGLSEILRAFPVTSASSTADGRVSIQFKKELKELLDDIGFKDYWEKRSPKWRQRIFEKTNLDYLINEKENELVRLMKI